MIWRFVILLRWIKTKKETVQSPFFALQDGLEPTTPWLTVRCSTGWAKEEYICWHYLFSRSVTRQVSSAHVSLTSVFGMGTGDPLCHCHRKYYTHISVRFYHLSAPWQLKITYSLYNSMLWSSPRPISIGQLNALLHLHLRPIYLVVCQGTYLLSQWDISSWGRFHA